MATAKEISDVARLRAMGAYKDWLENGKRAGALREKYGVGYNRIGQLVRKGERLCTPTRHWSYGTLTKAERDELMPLRDWLALIAGDC